MAKPLVSTARFRQAYDGLTDRDRDVVHRAVVRLAEYLETGQAAVGLGIKKLGRHTYEVRAGLALRIVYVEGGDHVFLAMLGNHDEVSRFLRRQ